MQYGNLNIRTRHGGEIDSKVSKCWLGFLATFFIISGLIEGCCFGFVGLSHNTFELAIGMSVLYSLTGVMALIMTCQPKRWVIGVTLIMALASAVSSSMMAFYKGLVVTNQSSLEGNGLRRNLLVWNNQETLPYSPLFPLTLVTVVMSSLATILVPMSVALMIICFNLLVSVRLANHQLSTKSHAAHFALIGIILVLVGIVTIIAFNVLANLGFLPNADNFWISKTLIQLSGITYILGGFVSLGTSGLQTMVRKVFLFAITFIILAATIVTLWKTVEIYGLHTSIGDTLEKPENGTYGIVVYDNNEANDTGVICYECLNDNNDELLSKCISIDEKCNGVFDFVLYGNVTSSNSCLYGISQGHFYDEVDCSHRWIGTYVCIIISGFLAIVSCLAIWISTGSSVMSLLCGKSAFV